MTNVFEQASRLKLRFNVKGTESIRINGMFSTEQLWDIPLVLLDNVYQSIQLQYSNSSSLLGENNMPEDDKVRCLVLKHIVETRIAEEDEAQRQLEKREERQKILRILEEKQDEALSNKSIEELEAMLE